MHRRGRILSCYPNSRPVLGSDGQTEERVATSSTSTLQLRTERNLLLFVGGNQSGFRGNIYTSFYDTRFYLVEILVARFSFASSLDQCSRAFLVARKKDTKDETLFQWYSCVLLYIFAVFISNSMFVSLARFYLESAFYF